MSRSGVTFLGVSDKRKAWDIAHRYRGTAIP